MLVPLVGGLMVGIIINLLPSRRYHGIADVMEACAFNSGRMGVRSGVMAAIAAALSLGSGAPLGREGPAVHIGASISAWFAERLGLDRSQTLALLGCGAAAAVTTSFNAPIAGVIFALEVVVGYYTRFDGYAFHLFTRSITQWMGAFCIAALESTGCSWFDYWHYCYPVSDDPFNRL